MSSVTGRSRLERLPEEMLTEIGSCFDRDEDIHNLARASYILFAIFEDYLYKKDLRRDGFHALRWAVTTAVDSIGVNTIRKCTDRLAMHKRRDWINTALEHTRGFATALHIAAALGKPRQVQLLLFLGANVAAPCRNLLAIVDPPNMPQIDHLGSEFKGDLNLSDWMPALVPRLRGDMPMFRLLQQQNPSSVLAEPRSPRPTAEAFTLHQLAVHLDHLPLLRASMMRYPTDRNVRSVASKSSVLHLAIKQDNERLFGELLALGHSTETFDRSGYSPLHLAVERSYLEMKPSSRSWAVTAVDRLLASGFSPVQRTACIVEKTPFLVAAAGFRHDWSIAHRSIKTVMSSLRQREREVSILRGIDPGSTAMNLPDGRGLTVQAILAKVIIDAKGNCSLENYFKDLVVTHNADVNVAMGLQRPSIMAQVIQTPGVTRFDKILVNLGANLPPGEVQDVFEQWYYTAN
ncbi:hypothetical protein ACJ41O_004501 [Fusarium nematophilum]